MDWDWHLIVEVATLIVAGLATTLIWAERTERLHARGLPALPQPHCRVVGSPDGNTLSVEASNTGASASRCWVVVQYDDVLYSGNCTLLEQQAWTPLSLTQLDRVDEKVAAPSTLLWLARDLYGHWSAIGLNTYRDGLVEIGVAARATRILRQLTGRVYTCTVSPDGDVSMHPDEAARADRATTPSRGASSSA